MKRVVVITGAAKGIGAAISMTLNISYPSGVHFVLFDKDGALLNATSELLSKNSW